MTDSVEGTGRRRATKTGCAVEATMSVLGGVWKPVLVFHLLAGKVRFNALCRLTPNATARMITLQLRELEATRSSPGRSIPRCRRASNMS